MEDVRPRPQAAETLEASLRPFPAMKRNSGFRATWPKRAMTAVWAKRRYPANFCMLATEAGPVRVISARTTVSLRTPSADMGSPTELFGLASAKQTFLPKNSTLDPAPDFRLFSRTRSGSFSEVKESTASSIASEVAIIPKLSEFPTQRRLRTRRRKEAITLD